MLGNPALYVVGDLDVREGVAHRIDRLRRHVPKVRAHRDQPKVRWLLLL
jgi:hypothetical protein